MADNPFLGWLPDNAGQQKNNEDPWEYYRWAGPDKYRARRLDIRQEPYMLSDTEASRYLRDAEARQRAAYSKAYGGASVEPEEPIVQTVGGGGRELTPGEKLAQMIGGSLPYQQATMVSRTVADYLNPDKQSALNLVLGGKGFIGDARRVASDFIRSVGQSTPQTIADISGVIADAVTGNFGKGQDYTLSGNKAQQYFDPGGAAQTIGSFVPDISSGVGAFKAATRSLTKMAAKSATGEAAGVAGRVGGWAAAGSAEPTALKMFGRFVSPAATRIERAAATAAAAVPTALNVAPEVASGRMNAAEGALTVALGAAAGPLSAGVWGGRMLTNIAGDVAVNLASQAATEVVPAIVPGGAQFDAAQVWKNMTYGAAMGTMFGIMNAKPIQGVGERSVLGARATPTGPDAFQGAFGDIAPAAGTVTGGVKPKMVEVAQQTEQQLFGRTTLPDNATAQEAEARLQELRGMAPQELVSLQRTPEGGVAAFSDQFRAEAAPDAATKNAVETERSIYANALAARYADNPEALAAILDLEVQPGELTPENAQQVLAAKITNEWLVQPVDGKGIAGVEARLAAAGVPGVAQGGAEAPAPEPVAGYPVEGVPTAFESAQMAEQATTPALPRTAFESAQMAEQMLPGTGIVPTQAQEGVLPRTAAESAQVAEQVTAQPLSRASYETALELTKQAEQKVGSAKQLASEMNMDVEDVLPPFSIEAKLYEAEKAGVPKEDAQDIVATELSIAPESYILDTGERDLIKSRLAEHDFAANIARIIRENPEGFTLDPITGEFASTGWAVAPSKKTEFRVPAAAFNDSIISDYVTKMQPLLEAGNKIGGWLNEADGRYYLDIVYIADNPVSAAILARDGQQIGVFHLDELNYYDTAELLQQQGIPDGYAAGPELRRVQEEFDRIASGAGILQSSDPTVPDSFAGATAAGQPRVKRPRKAREVVKADAPAQVLEALEGPQGQVESNVEYMGAAARPNSSVGSEDVKKVSDVLVRALNESEAARLQYLTTFEQEAQAAIASGGTRPVEGTGRQARRTAMDRAERIKDFIVGNDIELKVRQTAGGKAGLEESLIAALEGEPNVNLFRAAVKAGRRKFYNDTVELIDTDVPNTFTLRTNFPSDFKKALARQVEVAWTNQKASADVVVAANERAASRRYTEYERAALADLDTVLSKETDYRILAAARGENVPEGSFESRREILESGEDGLGTLDEAGYTSATSYKKNDKAQWRDKFLPKLNQAARYVDKKLKSLGYTEADNIKPLDIEQYIVADTGPGKWKEAGDFYVKNTMDAKVREILQKEYEAIAYPQGKKKGKPAPFIEALSEINGTVDDSYHTERFDTMIRRFEEGMRAANVMAESIGVDNPKDVLAWMRWNVAGNATQGSREQRVARARVLRDHPDFTEAKAAEITDKYNRATQNFTAYENAVNALESYSVLGDYVENERGAQAFQRLLNDNLLGNNEKYKLNLRSLQVLRGATLTTALFALDEGVALIEDNETYFGIPGSTLKRLLGNGETATYAMAGGGFMFGVKSRFKAGAKQGMQSSVRNSLRKSIESTSRRLATTTESLAAMTPQQRDVAADDFMARKYPSIKPGTEQYNTIKADKLAAEDLAAVKGWTTRQILDPLRKDKAKGTIGFISDLINDVKLVGAKSQFVQEYIVQPYAQTQAQVRRILKEIEDPINGVVSDYIRKYKKDRKFWDAFWALDYRMSDLELSEKAVSRAVIADARVEVMDEIKKQYFTDANGVVNDTKWADFMDFQQKLNPLRKEDLRTLYGKSLGINSWDIEPHYAELLVTKDRLNEAVGAAQQGFDEINAEINAANESYRALVDQVGRERADILNPGFKETMIGLEKARRDHQRNLRSLNYELGKVTKRIEKIDTIDVMIEKSQSGYYMYRHRDGKAPFVVRVQFDPKSGIPSTRREYESLSEAKAGQIEILRNAIAKKQATSAEYKAYIKKKTEITDRLAEIDVMDETTPEIDAEYQKLSKELDSIQGFKSVADMSDAEVFRFANDFEQLGTDATIQDMRRRSSVTRGSAAAKRVVDMVMSSATPVEAQLLTRTVDSGSLIKPGTDNIDYVPSQGNSALVDFGNSGQVLMAQGEDAFSINELVDQIDEMIDEPIDRAQLRDLLEKNYTYRETSKNAQNQKVETVWVDMGAVRRLIEAYTDPYVPNLVKRNNWVGYYDPDGKWTTDQRIDYTVKSIEGMLSRVQNYNSQVALRSTIEQATNWLDKWDINNGLREYVTGMQAYNDQYFKGAEWDKLKEYEMAVRRGVSFATLATNLGSAIGNRIQGFTMATAHGIQNATTKYGIVKSNPDGTRSEVKWMPSEVSARAELYKLQEKGETGWKVVEGFSGKALVEPRTYGLAIAAMAAPQKTLRWLADQDGYGKLPPSQQGKWARLYDMAQVANLEQGGVIGSYTVKQGIATHDKREQFLRAIGLLTDRVEKANNYTSIILSGLDLDARFGITDADWKSMGDGQKSNAIITALAPHRQRLDAAANAREVLQQEALKIEEQIRVASADVNRTQERIRLEKLLQEKKSRMARLATESKVLTDSMLEYVTYNRGFEQGDWDKISKSKLEKIIESAPGGHLALTMTAPILRSYNSWQAMMRKAAATEGGKMAKVGRAAGPLMGAAILTTLLGGAANPISMGGMFLADIAALAEMMYAYMTGEDGEKLDKIAGRQAWENMAADLAEKYGMDPVDARAYVRAAWPLGQSEGLLRQQKVLGLPSDVNITAGAGVWDITGGGTPAGVILSVGKNIATAWENMAEKYGGTGTWYDMAYAGSVMLPTSAKRIAQTSLQAMVPASYGGFGLVKVDKFGQPIYDKNQQVQRMDAVDIIRNTFVGKPWSETRSKLIAIEGGTPLYTEQDRIAWANTLGSTKYVQFGESVSGAMKGKGTAEQSNLALFERDAERLQRVISNRYKDYRPIVDNAKDQINSWYKQNIPVPISPDGSQTMPFRQVLSIAASGGTKSETELKGSAPDEIRRSMLAIAEDWGRSRAAADGVYSFYRGGVSIRPTEDLYQSETPEQFAIRKLGERFSRSYGQFLYRQQGRRAIGQ